MSYKIEWWDEEKTIVHILITDSVEIDTWIEMNTLAVEMAKSVSHAVFFIREYQVKHQQIPKKIFHHLPDLAKLRESYPPNLRGIVEVGAPHVRRFIHQVFVRIYGKGKLEFTESMAEALRFIEKEKQTIRHSAK